MPLLPIPQTPSAEFRAPTRNRHRNLPGAHLNLRAPPGHARHGRFGKHRLPNLFNDPIVPRGPSRHSCRIGLRLFDGALQPSPWHIAMREIMPKTGWLPEFRDSVSEIGPTVSDQSAGRCRRMWREDSIRVAEVRWIPGQLDQWLESDLPIHPNTPIRSRWPSAFVAYVSTRRSGSCRSLACRSAPLTRSSLIALSSTTAHLPPSLRIPCRVRGGTAGADR